MRFSYYDRLSASLRRVYDQSDRVTEVALPRKAAPRAAVAALQAALEADRRPAVQRVAAALVREITRALRVEDVDLRVLAVRPRGRESELHGLYVREPGKRPLVRVWMRTAAQRRVVSFRTFLRTLLHEVVHHLDYTYLGLPDSLHTEGFFKRESSLLRQMDRALAEGNARAAPGARADAGVAPEPERQARGRSPRRRLAPVQLELFPGAGPGPVRGPRRGG
jgi:hypothetical protein